VKAVRFALAGHREEEGHEESGWPSGGNNEEETGYEERGGRNGSQQHLAERSVEQVIAKEEKTASHFICGLCCKNSPDVSVWNCDGEILPVTDIICK